MAEDRFLNYTRNLTSLLGAVLVTVSAMLFLVFFGMELMGLEAGGAYLGIVFFIILPAVFVFGLLLIPFGAWRARRKARKANTGVPSLPVIDLNQSRTFRGALVFAALTAVNLVIVGLAAYKGIEVMDSVKFCGTACHDVMQPEYTAYQASPHARVKCTECHIGDGASWFVKSKLSGAWQLVSVTFDLYPKPIPTPVHNLRPARETCEACHWPEKFVGDKLKVSTHFTDDEETKPSKTVLLVHVGGQQPGGAKGIHWHVDPNVKIRFLTDAKRQNVRDVEMTTKAGTTVFKAQDPEGAKPPEGSFEWRDMDCIDCHNRPTHIYSTPELEIDRALREDRIDRTLPFVRKKGLEALKGEYASPEDARAKMGSALAALWSAPEHAEKTKDKKASIDKAVSELAGIWETHVFPKMNVKWGTYPSNLGHQQAEGCFRCHNDQHASADGKVISQKCATCHRVLAEDEEDPEILQQLKIK